MENLCAEWKAFLQDSSFEDSQIKIIYKDDYPIVQDDEGRKFSINFNDKTDYLKHKSGISSEILSRALGAGKIGKKVIDLSAGLCVDAVFLVQLGFDVVAIERNPLIYLCLKHAWNNWSSELKNNLEIRFFDSSKFLDQLSESIDVCYFDPMFPSKKKSALPKQEMVVFKNLVGSDEDAGEILNKAIQTRKFKRVVVKRPLLADPIESEFKPSGNIKGKVVRYDIYGS